MRVANDPDGPLDDAGRYRRARELVLGAGRWRIGACVVGDAVAERQERNLPPALLALEGRPPTRYERAPVARVATRHGVDLLQLQEEEIVRLH